MPSRKKLPKMVKGGAIPPAQWNKMTHASQAALNQNIAGSYVDTADGTFSFDYPVTRLLDCYLLADLNAPTNTIGDYTTATASVYFGYEGGYADNAQTITVHNRNPRISLLAGDYVTVALMRSGEWRPLEGGEEGAGATTTTSGTTTTAAGTTTTAGGTTTTSGEFTCPDGTTAVTMPSTITCDAEGNLCVATRVLCLPSAQIGPEEDCPATTTTTGGI